MYVVLVSCDYHAAVHTHRVFRSHRISSFLENGFKLLTESTPVGIEIENNNVSRCCIVTIEREEREGREGREGREERRKGRGGGEEGRINAGSEIAHLGSHPWLRAVFNKILQHNQAQSACIDAIPGRVSTVHVCQHAGTVLL